MRPKQSQAGQRGDARRGDSHESPGSGGLKQTSGDKSPSECYPQKRKQPRYRKRSHLLGAVAVRGAEGEPQNPQELRAARTAPCRRADDTGA